MTKDRRSNKWVWIMVVVGVAFILKLAIVGPGPKKLNWALDGVEVSKVQWEGPSMYSDGFRLSTQNQNSFPVKVDAHLSLFRDNIQDPKSPLLFEDWTFDFSLQSNESRDVLVKPPKKVAAALSEHRFHKISVELNLLKVTQPGQ